MTVQSNLSKHIYDGNGVTTEFPFTFPITAVNDIKVYYQDSNGALSLLTSGYSINWSDGDNSGSVTYPSGGGAAILPTGCKLILLRVCDLVQLLDLSQTNGFKPAAIERSLDLLTMIVQQLSEQIERAVKVDVAATDTPDDLIAALNSLSASAAAAAGSAAAQVELAEEQATLSAQQAQLAAAQVELATEKASAAEQSAMDAALSAASLNLPSQSLPADEGKLMVVKVGGGWDIAPLIPMVAAFPAHYERSSRWTGGAPTTAETRRTVTSPTRLTVNISDAGYVLSAAISLDLNTAGNWDSTATDYTDPANRAGKNFYVYACVPSSGTIPDLKLSANSTVPTGYTASNSRKVGGFHTLCVAVGTISGHTLTGYLQGDILPQSVWDLKHRPAANPEGMVYDAGTNKWVDIYLSSVSSGELASINGAVVADGVSSPAFHWYKLAQWLSRVKKRMLYQHEFVSASLGANQGTNITGSADPNTTTGHTDTAGRRMISNIGCEDTCGAYYQWGSDSLSGGADSWASAFDGNDSGVAGQHYRPANRVLLGGCWADGARCGSRFSGGDGGPLALDSICACRGCAEPGIPLS